MEKCEFPSIAVEPVGASRQRIDGAREQDYRDEHGDLWTCTTDGASRSWRKTWNRSAGLR